MAREMKYFMLFYDYRTQLELLSDEERGKLLMALFDYGEFGIKPKLEGMALMAFSFISADISRSQESYREKCEKNAENGKKGGRPKKANGFSENPNKANGFSENPTKAKKPKTKTNKNTKTNTNTNTKANNISSLCSEPFTYGESSEQETEPPVISLALNTGEDYPIYGVDIIAWTDLYPAVDVMQQLRNMKGWLDSNPTRRKTKKGIRRFINGWLQKEQDRGGVLKKSSNNNSDNWKKMMEEWAND